MVFKKITIVGTSEQGFTEAVDDAIDQASQTVSNIHWAEVESYGVEIASAPNREYQAEVVIAFEVTR